MRIVRIPHYRIAALRRLNVGRPVPGVNKQDLEARGVGPASPGQRSNAAHSGRQQLHALLITAPEVFRTGLCSLSRTVVTGDVRWRPDTAG